MRIQTFLATFFAYMCVHIMRMGIPFVQLRLAHFFKLSKQLIGTANSFAYIVLGFAYLYRVFHPASNHRKSYSFNVSLSALFYLLIPIYVYAGVHSKFLFFMSMGAFGFFQWTSWPSVLKLIEQQFTAEKDGFLLGIWSGHGDLGNIVGFFMFTVIIYYLNLGWQLCLMIPGVLAIITSIFVLTLPDPVLLEDPQQQIDSETMGIKHYIKDKQLIYLSIAACMLKSLLYGVLLWLPLYLEEAGFKQFQGYILISFSGATMIGSILLGSMYQKTDNIMNRSIILSLANLCALLSFWAIKEMSLTSENQWLLFILVGITGFSIAGTYNVLVTHEAILICERTGLDVSVLGSLLQAVGYIFVAIFQLIIGVSAAIHAHAIFWLFFILSFVCLGLLVARPVFIWCTCSKQEESPTHCIES